MNHEGQDLGKVAGAGIVDCDFHSRIVYMKNLLRPKLSNTQTRKPMPLINALRQRFAFYYTSTETAGESVPRSDIST